MPFFGFLLVTTSRPLLVPYTRGIGCISLPNSIFFFLKFSFIVIKYKLFFSKYLINPIFIKILCSPTIHFYYFKWKCSNIFCFVLLLLLFYIEGINNSNNKCLSCRVLFFTQPAHVIMALAVTLVAASMLPSNIKRTSGAENVKPRSFVNFVYLAAFCTHVGAQFWMTFISGK